MQSLIIAFAMYSKIPMPVVDWHEKNMRYAFCWFPLIGLVIGFLEWGAFYLLNRISSGAFFRGAVLTAIPLLVTGGIHLDGFLDTTDARRSYGDREKKLAILKDAHVGAFAVIGCGLYLLVSAAAWSELTLQQMPVMGLAFVLERVLSGLAAVRFKGARKDGMLAAFREPAEKQKVTAILVATGIVTAGLMIFAGHLQGLLSVGAALVIFAWYHHMAMKEFGGTTGDLAGWFLQSCELGVLLLLAVM